MVLIPPAVTPSIQRSPRCSTMTTRSFAPTGGAVLAARLKARAQQAQDDPRKGEYDGECQHHAGEAQGERFHGVSG